MKSTIAALALSLAVTPALAADLYVTGSVGTDQNRWISGVAVGADINKNLRVEGQYEYGSEHRMYVYAIPQYRIPTTSLTPYVLAGVGANVEDPENGKIVVGAGLRVELLPKLDLDLRYRSVEDVDTNRREDLTTVGLSLRF